MIKQPKIVYIQFTEAFKKTNTKMVTKNDICGWVKLVFSEIKGDFVKEIKETIKVEMIKMK